MESPEAKTKAETVFKGRIGEVVHETQPDGRVFERFRRPPGTRLIIIDDDQKILITREFRTETGNYDLRLVNPSFSRHSLSSFF